MKEQKELVVFTFDNKKQASFYDKVMKAIGRVIRKTFFFYGGAIRGGKTFVVLFILIRLAIMFPRSRWHVFRSDFPELEDTTIPSMEKLLGPENSNSHIWKRKSSNYHVLFKNGSKIFFKSENLMKDPELKWMLGLETNGIVMEQMEGLSEKLLERSIERVGSWYLPKMPPPLIMGTMNPTPLWPKKKVYDKWRNGTLPDDYDFTEALPSDNSYVTEDQWKNWENLDPISRAQMIEGIWRFLQDAKLFAYSFEAKKHVVDINTPAGAKFMTPTKTLPLKIIFDFNVDPIVATVAQNHGLNWMKIYKEYKLPNSDIFELLRRIKTDWAGYYLIVTGDASGRARSALTRGNRSYVQTIRRYLKLKPKQIQFPLSNPSVRNTRIVLNSILHSHPHFYIASSCLFTIDDLESVTVTDTGEIDKKKDAKKTHLLDTIRYLTWNYWRKWVGAALNNKVA